MAGGIVYGEFASFCKNVPSLAVCNVFFRRLLADGHIELLGLPLTSNLTSSPSYNATADANNFLINSTEVQSVIAAAGVGVNSTCAIPKAGYNGSAGNWPLAVVGLFSFLLMGHIWYRVNRRVAAVGRSEMMIFIGTFAGTIPFGVFASASFLPQASSTLLLCTAIQGGLLNALYGALLQCSLVETQLVEDGNLASLLPTWIFWFINFTTCAFTHLDTAYGWTKILGHGKPLPNTLKNNSLYTSDFFMPCIMMIIISLLKVYVSAFKLRERKPLAFNVGAGLLWGLGQVTTFTISSAICKASKAKVDGAFLAAALQAAAVYCMYHAWVLQTEETYADDDFSFETVQYGEKLTEKDEDLYTKPHDKINWNASTRTLAYPAPVLEYNAKYAA